MLAAQRGNLRLGVSGQRWLKEERKLRIAEGHVRALLTEGGDNVAEGGQTGVNALRG